MIKIRRPSKVPAILAREGVIETAALCRQFRSDPAKYRSESRAFAFDSNIYGHETVKSELKFMQHSKCCFCEAFLTHISSGDVEHFRPKAGFRQRDEDGLERPGYYWLAYAWDNLLFCCEICNRRHKRNLFPLADHSSRARDPDHSLAQESPLFVNPTADDPTAFISFRDETPFAVDGNEKGITTIEALGLHRSELSDDRLRHLRIIRLLASLAIGQPATPEGKEARALIDQLRADAGEYAGMVRAELSRNYSVLQKATADSDAAGDSQPR
jgi:uncharacterized protein (TIGR02646 family)